MKGLLPCTSWNDDPGYQVDLGLQFYNGNRKGVLEDSLGMQLNALLPVSNVNSKPNQPNAATDASNAVLSQLNRWRSIATSWGAVRTREYWMGGERSKLWNPTMAKWWIVEIRTTAGVYFLSCFILTCFDIFALIKNVSPLLPLPFNQIWSILIVISPYFGI